MNKKIILTTLLIILLIITSCSNNIDSKNEEILTKLLEIEQIHTNKVIIKNQQIFVSIETSAADEYDTQLINWWGTIFGLSGILQGNYEVVIIENTINKEPSAYISTNIYTIKDFNEDKITDIQFWEETLITSDKPNTKQILEASGLPKETLNDKLNTKIPLSKTTKIILFIAILILIIAIIIISIIIIKKKKTAKTKTANSKIDKQNNEEKKPEEKKKEKSIKKTKENMKKFYEETIKTKTNKLAEKTKEKTKNFKNRLKQEPKI